MTTAALPPSALLPQPPAGLGPGLLLALAVHAALVGALTLGVDWRTHAPEPMAAELWAAVPTPALPETAAPPPPVATRLPPPVQTATPAVTLPAPDIALERERQRRIEAEREVENERRLAAARENAAREKAEREAKAAEARAAAEERAAEDRLARQREDNLRRMLGQASAAAGVGTPAIGGTPGQAAGPSAGYQGRVKSAILPNIVYAGKAPPRAIAEVEVTLAPGGTIISRRLVKRSGHADWDEAVLRAIDRTPRLPADTDGRVPPALLISFRPNE